MEPGGDVAWQQMASEGAAGLLRDGRRVSEADEQAAAEEAKKVAAVEGQGKDVYKRQSCRRPGALRGKK